MQKLSFLDKAIDEFDNYLRLPLSSTRKSPSENVKDIQLTQNEKKHSAGLMRVDHTGEVCAQGLYRGQARVAKSKQTQKYLYQAASEEADHLAWCADRLKELDTKPSLLTPFWYWASFGIGTTSGIISDSLSYGFVVETEKQVMKHIDSHLESLPKNDNRSRAILKQMYIDESQHAAEAEKAGATKMPKIIKMIMKFQSKIMTNIAYRF